MINNIDDKFQLIAYLNRWVCVPSLSYLFTDNEGPIALMALKDNYLFF